MSERSNLSPSFLDSSLDAREGRTSSVMKALAPLIGRCIDQVQAPFAIYAGPDGQMVLSSGEKHSRGRDERRSNTTAHFSLGTSGSTGRVFLMYGRVQIATAMVKHDQNKRRIVED